MQRLRESSVIDSTSWLTLGNFLSLDIIDQTFIQQKSRAESARLFVLLQINKFDKTKPYALPAVLNVRFNMGRGWSKVGADEK
jgi:hypothetical protein